MRSRPFDLQAHLSETRGRVLRVDTCNSEDIGRVFVAVDCGLDTPAEDAVAAADLPADVVLEEVGLSHRRTFGGVHLVGWTWTIKGWREGARSSLADGCVEALQ